MSNKVNKITSIRDMMTQALNEQPEFISHKYKKNGEVIEVPFREFYDSVEAIGAKLTDLGFGASHIACIGENSYPWIQTFVAVLQTSGVFVPIDKELPADNIIFLINDSDSQVVFCSKKYEAILKERRAELPNIKYFVCFDEEEDNGEFLSMNKFIESGRMLDKTAYDSLTSDPNELKYLVYTSGTTGVAKGVMLTEHNIVSGIYYGMQVSSIHGTGLSVLPYNHTYEAVCDILVSIHARATLCINEAIKYVMKNIQLYKPNHIYLVPAFSEHFYKAIQDNIRKQHKEKLFARMIKISNGLRKIGIDMRKVFFKAILSQFGGNLTRIVCGGAPIREETSLFFDSIGITLTGGYGITECSPLVSVNDITKPSFSTAGHRLSCLEWRIDNPSESGIGEICVKGDVVMKGYYKRPDLTEQAIRDGWFYTGDYGYITAEDEIVITGRKKNIIILSNGKNIYPEELELLISNVPYITEVVVYGKKNEFGEEVSLTAEIYMEEPNNDKAHIMADIKKEMAQLPGYKQIHDLVIRDVPFEKTTTNKIKRDSITKI